MSTLTPDRTGVPAPRRVTRASIPQRTLRRDRWWLAPTVTVVVLVGFIAYGTWAAFRNSGYFTDPYISPFYSPCLTDSCPTDAGPSVLGGIWPWSPALLILAFPLGFRLTCYYYRKAYYRSFWQSPPACAVAEPHKRYTGEARFPLILQNVHRYFFYISIPFALILIYHAFRAFDFPGGIGIGVGSIVLLVNAALISLYTASCHSCRHLCGGGLKQFSRAPRRYRLWRAVSVLNKRHMQLAWASLLWIAFADFYIWLVATDRIHDFHWVF
ncbi:MAG: hypothetical protein ACXV5Q_06050 [Frankiaceae bacterium]